MKANMASCHSKVVIHEIANLTKCFGPVAFFSWSWVMVVYFLIVLFNDICHVTLFSSLYLNRRPLGRNIWKKIVTFVMYYFHSPSRYRIRGIPHTYSSIGRTKKLITHHFHKQLKMFCRIRLQWAAHLWLLRELLLWTVSLEWSNVDTS